MLELDIYAGVLDEVIYKISNSGPEVISGNLVITSKLFGQLRVPGTTIQPGTSFEHRHLVTIPIMYPLEKAKVKVGQFESREVLRDLAIGNSFELDYYHLTSDPTRFQILLSVTQLSTATATTENLTFMLKLTGKFTRENFISSTTPSFFLGSNLVIKATKQLKPGETYHVSIYFQPIPTTTVQASNPTAMIFMIETSNNNMDKSNIVSCNYFILSE